MKEMSPASNASRDSMRSNDGHETSPEDEDQKSTTSDMDWVDVLRSIPEIHYPPRWPCENLIDAVHAVEEWERSLRYYDGLDVTKAEHRLAKAAFAQAAFWTPVGVSLL